ncbi:MAG: Gfo/Idh/MocA family oxidoreductase [Chloroflexota bacterium]|nr:Gfo/Idh/MocA family oxidoreductase [Chloroflexota bacterium]MDE2958615.1 Gfo/Idh/MocA family oxidoreductase [Chloroflexota bacterium]
MSLGLCVLGCGSFAAVFARSVALLRDEVDLYFASRHLARAQDYSVRFGGLDAFGSYEDAAVDPRVEAVYVCTPHHLHREHASLAFRAGKHVLVEKPIAGTLDDAEAMVREAASAGVTFMVAENYRFLPPVQEAKRLIEQGRAGRVRLIQLHEQFPFKPGGWRSRAELNGGGVLIDGGIHKLSAVTYLAGRPNEVYAREILPGQPGLEAEDGAVVMTRDADGVVGLINHSWSVVPPQPHSWVSISGTEASLYFEPGKPWLKVTDAGSETTVPLADHGNGLVPMVREFASSIAEGRPPAMTGADGLADLALVLAAYESMETGLPVRLG